MRFVKILLLVLVLSVLHSCSYKSKKILFKTANEIKTDVDNPIIVTNPQEYKPYHLCQEGDVLYVRLLNEDGVRSTFDKLTTSKEDARFVVHDSVITLPSVGNVYVLGLSKNEIIEKVSLEYAKYIIDPIIDVDFVSLSVNILGEVLNPGRYAITERMNLIEALGLAGGFSAYGIFTNVKVIRGEGNNQEIISVNVTDIRVLGNEKLLLHDRDIVYVEPRRAKQFDTAVKPYLFITSILASAATVFIVFITRTK